MSDGRGRKLDQPSKAIGSRRLPLNDALRVLQIASATVGTYTLGRLTSAPARSAPSLVGPPTRAALEELGWLDLVGVVEIDPDVSDTAASQATYQLPPDSLANCVVIAGKREGTERLAACVVLFTTRADINGTARRNLDVRKASFISMDDAVRRTGMEYGGITPIGLPTAWTVLIDRRVIETDIVLIGSGIRRSKLLLPGDLLGELPGAEVVSGLGMLAAT